MRVVTILTGLLLGALVQPGAAQSGSSSTSNPPEANPARPTVSTPATLTPVGYLQFETGLLVATTSPEFSSQLSVNQVTKITVHPRLQLLLLSQPIARSRVDQQTATQAGDVQAGAQFVLVPGGSDKPTVAVSYIRRLYSGAAPNIDIGTLKQSVTFLVSGDVAGFHADANAIITDQDDGSVNRTQFGQTLSISHPVGRFTIAGEIWHFSQPLLNSQTTGNLWAVSYPVRKNLVLDAGFNRGLTKTSTRWEIFAGFTYLLPRHL
jgi:hypothetical protein